MSALLAYIGPAVGPSTSWSAWPYVALAALGLGIVLTLAHERAGRR